MISECVKDRKCRDIIKSVSKKLVVSAIVITAFGFNGVFASMGSTEVVKTVSNTSTNSTTSASSTVSNSPALIDLYNANPDTTTYSDNPLAFEQPPKDIAATPAAVSLDASADLGLPVKAAVLMSEDTGEVLYKQNMDVPMPMASITKIMTMLLVFEEVDKGNIALTDLVKVSEHAASMGGSQVWLDPSESFTVDEMLRAVCVSSANDAAVALAEHVAGSEPVFVEMMNRRAAELGMVNTSYANACGLDQDGLYSTAYDIALLSRKIMEHDELVKYTTVWTDSLRDGQTMLVNTNKLLNSYSGITGLKTGTTSGAGICISATAERDNMSMIAVVLGADSSSDRFDAARTLLDFGFANFQAAVIPNEEDFVAQLPLSSGLEQTVLLDYLMPEKLLLQKNQQPELTAELELPESLTAPVKKGDVVGSITLYSGESAISSYDVVAAQDYEQITFELAFQRFAGALLEF